MTRSDYRLLLAFILSITLHVLPFLPITSSPKTKQKPLPPLAARLTPPPLPAPQPILLPPPENTPALPQTAPAPPPKKAVSKPAPALRWENAVRQQINKLKAEGKYYSREAYDQRLEGEVVVLMVLDEAGNVTATRVEESSGHPILDRDAQNAARRLRDLPADAPREVQLPLRFRLKD